MKWVFAKIWTPNPYTHDKSLGFFWCPLLATTPIYGSTPCQAAIRHIRHLAQENHERALPKLQERFLTATFVYFTRDGMMLDDIGIMLCDGWWLMVMDGGGWWWTVVVSDGDIDIWTYDNLYYIYTSEFASMWKTKDKPCPSPTICVLFNIIPNAGIPDNKPLFGIVYGWFYHFLILVVIFLRHHLQMSSKLPGRFVAIPRC